MLVFTFWLLSVFFNSFVFFAFLSQLTIILYIVNEFNSLATCLADASIHNFIIFSHTGCYQWSVEKMSFLAVTTLPCLGRLLLIFFVDKISGKKRAREKNEVMLLIGIRENAKYIDGKSRGLTASRKAGFTKKFRHGMQDFLLVCREFGNSKSNRRAFSCFSGVSPIKANYRVT